MTELIAVIRLRGLVKIRKDVELALSKHLLVKRTLHCAVCAKVPQGVLQKCKDFITWGPIDKETLQKLVEKRGKPEDEKKIEAGETTVFRLHPPRGGFKKSTKLPFPKGELGLRDETSMQKLIVRML